MGVFNDPLHIIRPQSDEHIENVLTIRISSLRIVVWAVTINTVISPNHLDHSLD